MTTLPALLLVGPTGSGKTPLGELLESRGLWGRRCVHFDFGENLRQVATAAEPEKEGSPHLCEAGHQPEVGRGPFRHMGTVPFFQPEDIEFCREVLRSGALLEDKDLPLAERILRRFLVRRGVDAGTSVVLNGLPRHVGQARALEAVLDVQVVINLRCSPETVLARICGNVGGDRAGRTDDEAALVERKLATFHERTEPLLGYYCARNVRVETLDVTAGMTAEEMWEGLVPSP